MEKTKKRFMRPEVTIVEMHSTISILAASEPETAAGKINTESLTFGGTLDWTTGGLDTK